MAEVATTEQQTFTIEERTQRRKEILEKIPSKFIISTWPIDPKAIKENTDYEFLILDTKWNDLNFNKYPGEGNYPHNRFLKVINNKKYICFYMRTENPTTLKQNKRTNESNIESFEKLLEYTGFGENWVIIQKEYLREEVEKKEKEEETKQQTNAKDIKQELMEKFGLSEEEISQDIFYKMEEFKNLISADAAIQLVLKDHEQKNQTNNVLTEEQIMENKQPTFEFVDEPDPDLHKEKIPEEKALTSYQEKKIQGSLDLAKDTIKNYLCKDATDEELALFVHFCKVNNLDPFKNEVFIIKYHGQPAFFHTSKDVFNKRASNQPDFGGLEAGIIILKDKKLEKREGTILLEGEELVGGYCYAHRKDKRPFYAEASLKEFIQYRKRDGQPNKFWKEKPALMIRKVAFAHALREAYPNELAGLYLSEEMPQEG